MTTGTVGDSARLFPWQVPGYFVRGGPNDPVLPTTTAVGTLPAAGGTFTFNSVATYPPVAGQAANRSMTINLTTANIGGIFIGTIPKGAWIIATQFFVYTAFTGGAGQAIGVGYVTASTDTTYPPTMTGYLGTINGSGAATGPPAGLFGGEKPVLAVVAGDGYTAITSQGFQMGPGNGTTGSGAQLASLDDINLYVFTSGAVTGTGASISAAATGAAGASPFTAGCAAVRVSYTGLEG
jgi:hypothetical protein